MIRKTTDVFIQSTHLKNYIVEKYNISWDCHSCEFIQSNMLCTWRPRGRFYICYYLYIWSLENINRCTNMYMSMIDITNLNVLCIQCLNIDWPQLWKTKLVSCSRAIGREWFGSEEIMVQLNGIAPPLLWFIDTADGITLCSSTVMV
jgi:hypothetical protein